MKKFFVIGLVAMFTVSILSVTTFCRRSGYCEEEVIWLSTQSVQINVYRYTASGVQRSAKYMKMSWCNRCLGPQDDDPSPGRADQWTPV